MNYKYEQEAYDYEGSNTGSAANTTIPNKPHDIFININIKKNI